MRRNRLGAVLVSIALAVKGGESVRAGYTAIIQVIFTGAAYRLAYRPQPEHITGLYHQPLLGQTFEVMFRRETP